MAWHCTVPSLWLHSSVMSVPTVNMQYPYLVPSAQNARATHDRTKCYLMLCQCCAMTRCDELHSIRHLLPTLTTFYCLVSMNGQMRIQSKDCVFRRDIEHLKRSDSVRFTSAVSQVLYVPPSMLGILTFGQKLLWTEGVLKSKKQCHPGWHGDGDVSLSESTVNLPFSRTPFGGCYWTLWKWDPLWIVYVNTTVRLPDINCKLQTSWAQGLIYM